MHGRRDCSTRLIEEREVQAFGRVEFRLRIRDHHRRGLVPLPIEEGLIQFGAPPQSASRRDSEMEGWHFTNGDCRTRDTCSPPPGGKLVVDPPLRLCKKPGPRVGEIDRLRLGNCTRRDTAPGVALGQDSEG